MDRKVSGAAPRGRLVRLCLKELRETLRDRRTLVTLVVMPLILYPLLSIVFERFLMSQAVPNEEPQVILGVLREEQLGPLQRILSLGQVAQGHGVPRLRNLLRQDPTGKAPATPTISVKIVEDLQNAVMQGEVDVGVSFESQTANSSTFLADAGRLEITFQKGILHSEIAAEFLSDNFEAANQAALQSQLKSLGGIDQPPFRLRWKALPARTSSGLSMAAIIPLILVLMTMTGAVYPAIDLTAGERERGTLEALVAAPVPRFSLLFAKYLAVVAVSILTATANLAAMSITLYATGIGQALLGGNTMSVTVLVYTMLLLILFAFFFSAVLLAATSFARSFKEAQAYLIPLTLASLGPSLCSLLPGVSLTPSMAAIPLINLVLLARDIFAGDVAAGTLGIVLFSTVMYSVAAISVAANYFGSDAVLYRNDILWSDLFRRPRIARDQPSTGEALMTLVMILPLNILSTHLLARWFGKESPRALLLGMSILTIVLFVVIPSLASWMQRLTTRVTFALRPAPSRMFIAGALLGISLTPLLIGLLKGMGMLRLSTAKLMEVQQLVREFQQVPGWMLLLALAIIPAICEEFFFRGYLYSAVAAEGTPAKASFVSSVLFGIFHVLGGAIALERFIPSAMIGFVLAGLRHRSQSILPGIVLHAVHNGAIAVIAYNEKWLSEKGYGDLSQRNIFWILAASLAVIVVAALLSSGRSFSGGGGARVPR